MSWKLSRKGFMTLLVMNGIAFVAGFVATGLNVALPSIIEEFALASTTGQVIATANTLVNGVCMLLSPAMYSRFNTRRLVIFCSFLMLTGILTGALFTGFIPLLLSRMLCGCAIGLYMPGIYLIFNNLVIKEARGKVLGNINMIIAISPIIATLCGGWLTDNFGWQSMFWLGVPPAVLLVWLAWKYMDDYSDETQSIFELPSFLLIALGCCVLLYTLTIMPEMNYDYWTFLLIAAAICLIVFFIRRQQKLTKPFIDLSAFKILGFRYVLGIAVIDAALTNACKVFIPILFYNNYKINSTELALLLIPATIITAITPGIIGRFMDTPKSHRNTVLIAILMLLSACAAFIIMPGAPVIALCAVYAVYMVAISIISLSMSLRIANNLPQNVLTHGTCIFNSTKNIAGGIGTAAVSAIYGIFLNENSAASFNDERAFFGILCSIAVIMLLLYLQANKFKDKNII